ncbi:MAG: alanine racemase [Phycisphaeraceae bacterium]
MTTTVHAPSAAEVMNDPLQIPTPAMVIDLARVERNLQRMIDYTRMQGLALRPHTKTHKSRRMGARQIELGAVGLTVAKVDEAQVMADVADDLLIAYPALDPYRTTRIAELAQRVTVRVAVDSAQACDALADRARAHGTTVGILVDLDVGFHRTGVQSPEAALALAQHVDRTAGLRLDGLFCFPGQLFGSFDEQADDLAQINQLFQQAIDLWRRHGLEAAIVSGGSTPGGFHSHHITALTEIRPGTYIYNDVNCIGSTACTVEQCAATVMATVVSNAVPGKVVVDAGSKSLTRERYTRDAALEGHGRVVELPDARVVRLSEEHGEIDIARCERQPALGQRLHIIPVHVCPSINLHDRVWLRHPDGRYEPSPVDARGRVC